MNTNRINSWLPSANIAGCEFPLANLPYAVFSCGNEKHYIGVGIGDSIVNLCALEEAGLFDELDLCLRDAVKQQALNQLMGLGHSHWTALRLRLVELLSKNTYQNQVEPCLIPQVDVSFHLPCQIGDYTDFYTSVHHATRVGSLFRPDNPLLPNYKWIPIGYHGRSSSIRISGEAFKRPVGQLKAPDAECPELGLCKRLDYELELGIFIGKGSQLGTPVSMVDAEQHVFGVSMFNDWSARDIQAWEYQPLGPFLSKNFFSSLSPWIVPMEALAPYRCDWTRDSADPQPLDYLDSKVNRDKGAIDIKLEVWIETAKMRADNQPAERLSKSNFKESYWTIAQMVTHHTVNGCDLKPGDLLGSGTQSGPNHEESGSLLELTAGGKAPITLSNGEQRSFVEDGDRIILKGYCGDDQLKIGLGQVDNLVLSGSKPE
ncbi:fumarylacetoacetase [Marinomonas rhizomae]|uniref:fumarylacetoacetase n=1 Tax=Marinomonas rhizomae TaxID=491948 RepID=A0A366JEJ4_9GAMM|nr:fumarylacetoacetase [Marinomonas rhizomae]RBP84278.1 fumarylacetoacetate hydrolase [Marinomonas rhizomae]RNF74597.1 fumarylacetoacetase [Marinomonas rhizomae]